MSDVFVFSRRKPWRSMSMAVGLLLSVTAASAQSLSIPFANTFRGLIEARVNVDSGTCIKIYRVPAGRRAMITDLAVDSFGSSASIPFQYLCTGGAKCENGRMNYVTAPGGGTFATTFSTGISVDPGDALFACNQVDSQSVITTAFTIRGFLYSTGQ